MSENKELISAKDAHQLAAPTSNTSECQTIDRRAFLKLPAQQRNALLQEQVLKIAEDFLPGAEGMEWTDEYIDDEIEDDE